MTNHDNDYTWQLDRIADLATLVDQLKTELGEHLKIHEHRDAGRTLLAGPQHADQHQQLEHRLDAINTKLRQTTDTLMAHLEQHDRPGYLDEASLKANADAYLQELGYDDTAVTDLQAGLDIAAADQLGPRHRAAARAAGPPTDDNIDVPPKTHVHADANEYTITLHRRGDRRRQAAMLRSIAEQLDREATDAHLAEQIATGTR